MIRFVVRQHCRPPDPKQRRGFSFLKKNGAHLFVNLNKTLQKKLSTHSGIQTRINPWMMILVRILYMFKRKPTASNDSLSVSLLSPKALHKTTASLSLSPSLPVQ